MNNAFGKWFARLALCAVLVGEVVALPAQAQIKPNVVVFLADDMGIGDTSAYLNKKLEQGSAPISLTIKTPQLERLASMGTIFTDVHSPSSMCSTSRYALLTGRYAWRSISQTTTIINGWAGPRLIDSDRSTIGNMFQNAGYDTIMLGKWHQSITPADLNGNPYNVNAGGTQAQFNNIRWPTAQNPDVQTVLVGPREQGFDYWLGTLANNDPVNGGFRGFFENDKVLGIPQWDPGQGPVVPTWDVTKIGETLGNKALDLIGSHGAGGADAGNPFFMYFASLSNHSIASPATSISLGGQSYLIDNQAKRTDGIDATRREDMVRENDIIVGAMLDKLQNTIDPQTGQPMIDNTVFIFTSDNGADAANGISPGGLRDRKRSIYEGGHRVPFIAVWPGQTPAGGVSDQTFGLNDLYASFAALTGQSLGPTEAEDSENVLAAIKGQTVAQFQRPGNLIVHDDSSSGSFSNDIPDGAVLAIRLGKMKLIVGSELVNTPTAPAATAGQAIPLRLYDLSVDPTESNNLLGNPAYAAITEEMRQEVLKYRNQGFSRGNIQTPLGPLFKTDGGADLAQNLNGSVGYEFTVGNSPIAITRLGMWDDGAGDVINQEDTISNPDGNTVGTPDGLATPHWVRLFSKTTGQQVAAVQITNANSYVEGEFRYVDLSNIIALHAGQQYALTMSTTSGSGDLFHTPAPFSGVSPISTLSLTDFVARRSGSDGAYPTLLPNGAVATGAATEEMFANRFYVGPTAGLTAIPISLVDFNGDGTADGADFLIWQRGLGTPNATRSIGDADGNGVVDGLDLSLWTFVATMQSAADFNSDGVIDGADGKIWQQNLGDLAASRLNGDAQGDGVVDAADLAIWIAQFGAATSPAFAAAIGSIPEPATVSLAGVALIVAGLRRRAGRGS